jgi:hypothetical protein
MKIFLSAVSDQFKACRDALATDLRAVGAEVVVQEDFQQHGRSLLEKLQDYIASCDRVVALAGDAYGWEPDETARPAGYARRSYTQWEYRFAQGERLNDSPQSARPTYVYFASPEFLMQHVVMQDANAARRQQEFVSEIRSSGKDYNTFGSLHELRALVLRDGFRLAERGPKPCNLPYKSLGLLFKGRATFLDELRQRFQGASDTATAAVPMQVIRGLGGVGKTRAAIEYALAYEENYCALLFVVANTVESLQRNVGALCEPDVLNLPERAAKEQATRVVAVIRWLQTHPGWLLILDNVDTREAASGVEQVLAKLHGGHILITGRWSTWSGSVRAVDLDLLPNNEAVAFLLERTANQRRKAHDDLAPARNLATEMGGLALALEQAAAFINRQRISFDDYLDRWRARERKVRTWYDAGLMQYPRNVAVTWDTTFAELDEAARALLQILCWFAGEPLPRVAFDTQEAKQALIERIQSVNGGTTADMEDAIAGLADFSLVAWESGNEAFRIHRLVQEVTRERIAPDQRSAWIHAALAVLNARLPPPDYRADVLISHGLLCLEWILQWNIDSDAAHRLQESLGLWLFQKARFPKDIEQLSESVTGIREYLTFFHLRPSALRREGTHRVISFKPGGQFRPLVTVEVELDNLLYPQRVELRLSRSFLNPPTRPFAADMAKSFLKAATSPDEREALGELIEQIWHPPQRTTNRAVAAFFLGTGGVDIDLDHRIFHISDESTAAGNVVSLRILAKS